MTNFFRTKILVTAGGRAELRIWLVHSSQCSAAEEVAHHFLKGNDKQRLKTWRDHELIDDTEPAFLSVAIIQNNIFASSSDGNIRKWSFHLKQKSLTFLNQSQTFPNAILKILKLKNGSILSGDTAGRIRVFESEFLQPIRVIENIHQNGINALLLFSPDQIVSGGDDGHISCSKTGV